MLKRSFFSFLLFLFLLLFSFFLCDVCAYSYVSVMCRSLTKASVTSVSAHSLVIEVGSGDALTTTTEVVSTSVTPAGTKKLTTATSTAWSGRYGYQEV